MRRSQMMSKDSIALWTRLYEVCKKLRKLNPWEFWSNQDIILIEDSVTKMMGYCVVEQDPLDGTLMINILHGQDGMRAYLESLNYDFEELEDMNYIKSSYRQQGFLLLYANRDELFEEDYERIKSVGMSFRGKAQWPILRRLFPGSKPWLLETDEDVRLLTMYLDQLVQVLTDFDQGKIDLRENFYLTISVQNGKWTLTYTEEDELLGEEEIFIYPNELKAHRVSKLPKQPVIMEGSQFYLPTPLWDEENNRELFPLLTTFINHESGEVYSGEIYKSTREELELVSDRLADLLLTRLQFRPREIIVSDEILLDLISDFCEKANIDCDLGPTVAADAFMNSFLSTQMGDLNGEEQAFLHLIQAAEQSYEVMLETHLGQMLNPIQKSALKDIWIYSVLFLYKEFNELPGEWSKEGFEALLQSHLLEESVKNDYRPYIGSSIKAYLDCQQELGLFKNSFVLSHVLAKYYK